MNNRIRSIFLIILIVQFFLSNIERSTANVSFYSSFNHISQKDGLPNNLVECMLQDHIGYLWFGTKRGLCRYDGYDLKNYRSDINDSTSLPYHHITALLETSDSTLWVAVWRNGLCIYNREQDNFFEVNVKPTIFPATWEIKRLFEDSKQRIWVIHQYGISILKLNGEVIKDMDNSLFKEDREVSAIFETEDEKILIAAGENIYSYNSSLQTFKKIENSGEVLTGIIHQFYQVNDHKLWMAADYGLFIYDLHQKTISLVLKSNEVPFKFIIEDEQENIWSGGSFPVCYEKQSGQIHYFNRLSEQYVSKSGNFLTCGIIDNQKNLWFGNSNRGIDVLYKKNANFDYYPNVQRFLKDNAIDVTTIFRDKEGTLFIGTSYNGLLMFDKNEKRIEFDIKYTYLSHLKSPSNLFRDIKSDPNGNIWFGSGGVNAGDITIYNPKNNSFEQYDKAVSSFLFDSKGNIWIGEAAGAALFDSEKKQFRLNPYKNLPIRGIADWMEDNEGNIWIASYDNGFFLANIYEKKFIKANDKYKNLPDTRGISLLTDSKGRMWLGTEFYGLFYKDSDQDQFKQLTRKDGLPSNDICSIVEDKNGNIWIGTNHGLSRFNYTSGRFKNYFINDGLSGDEFNYNAFFIDDNGVLLFGTTNGLVAFDPDNIKDEEQPLPLVINEITINNGRINSDVNGLSINEALISHNPITLKHNQNNISIKFTTINLSSSQKSQFAYMLKGSDEAYHFVGDQRQMNYTKLPPGEYQFSVKASNNDNVWSENEATFSFIIRRHPMQSTIAYVLYFIMFCLIAVIVFHFIRHQNQLKNEIVIERLAKQQQDDLVKMKLSFFTNISHEFKTPLSLIISPLEELIEELHGNSSIKKKLAQIRSNSQRLLTLINQLIEFRKMEYDVLPVKHENLNLLEITRNAMNLFSALAEQRNIHFELKTDMQVCRINSDKDKIEKILNNLLSNAFKYTPENGTIAVSLQLVNNNVQISIKDTGTGISEQSLKHIFDRFYQEKHAYQISGIGMSYVKKMLELLGGTIEIESEIDKGTEVIFTIPNAHQAPMVEVFNQSSSLEQLQNNEPNKIKPDRKIKDKEANPDSQRILVVEDEYEMRKHLCSMLQNTYNVDEAEDGLAGFEMVQKTEYNLVISDIMMPRMDGLELCSKIKSDPKTNHIIVIMLSVKDEVESEMEGYKTGANVYLSKPFLPQKLLSIIKNQLYTQQKAINHYTGTNPEDSEKLIGVSLKEKEFIDQVSLFIEENLHKQDFGIERITEEFGLSRSNLYKKFKVITNVSPKDFIKEIRMKKAVRLLKENNLTASEIAYDLGFSSATNFFTAFKSYYGKTPKEFRKETGSHV